MFGATERMRFPGPDGTVAHAEIEIGDRSSSSRRVPGPGDQGAAARWPGRHAGVPFIYVEDVDAVVARAVELGAHAPAAPAGPVLRRPRRLTSSTRSGMGGPSRRTWRTWSRRS